MATEGASRTPPLTGGCVTDVSATTHPPRRFSPDGEREGGDALPYNAIGTGAKLCPGFPSSHGRVVEDADPYGWVRDGGCGNHMT